MGQDDLEEKIQETEKDEAVGMDDVQAEPAEETGETQEGEADDADGVQADPVEEEQEMKMSEEIGWDDVQKEQTAGAHPPAEREVSGVRFKEMQKSEVGESLLGIDFILDIPLTVSVELGRGKMMISELLKLGRGSIIELAKLAGEPLDVFVNDRLIAMGEVVVANEKFGIRLTDVVSHAERIDQLK
jgi:flagellar motor switch protein FliN/FliY